MPAHTPRDYYSSSDYQFQDKHSDAIVRVASYHRKDFCRSVIWFSSREHDPIRSSISTSFQRRSGQNLGILDRLPLELLQETILRLDMHSLFKLRQANGMIRKIVDSVVQYQLVVLHGLNLLCALLRTRLAVNITLHDYYQILCTKQCAFCNEFSGFVHLLTWTRCCFQCLQEDPKIQLQTRTAVQKQFHLTKTQSKQLRSLKSLPGIYSMDESVLKSRVTLVSTEEARSAFRQEAHVSTETVSTRSTRSQKYNFMGSCALPYYDRWTGKTEHGVSCAGCQYALENDIIGYRGGNWASKARDKEYAKDGFLAHFRRCKQAQLLWISSNQGDRSPAGLPEAARRGGFFNART